MEITLKELFKESIDFLSQQHVYYGHGVEIPEDEVLLLMMFVLDMDYVTLNTQPDLTLNTDQVEQVRQMLQKRVDERIPMSYLVGFSVFAGLTFKVDDRVLIPRSPFAELIDLGFQPWMNWDQQKTVLDLCTGCGCIGLAIAHYFKAAQVDISDLSTDALELALFNRESLQLNDQVSFVHSDLFENIKGQYDLIVTNPPYVDQVEYEALPPEYEYEPKAALVSDREGMEIPVRILHDAPDYLSDQGFLFLEVGYNDEVLESLFPEIPFEWVHLSMGGQGICVFQRADLVKYRSAFKTFLESDVT